MCKPVPKGFRVLGLWSRVQGLAGQQHLSDQRTNKKACLWLLELQEHSA